MPARLENAFAPFGSPKNGTSVGTVRPRDNPALSLEAAEAVATESGAMDPDRFERTMAESEGRPTTYRPDDPRLLVGAPPLRSDRERRLYANFRSALSVKEHEEARELRNRAEIRRRNFLHRHDVDVGLYMAYCLDAVPGFETFFFRA